MIRVLKKEVLASGHALAESPNSGLLGKLIWVDIERDQVVVRSAEGENKVSVSPLGATSVWEIEPDIFLVTGKNSVFSLHGDQVNVLWEDNSPTATQWRFNDSILTPGGDLLIGTKSLVKEQSEQRLAVYRAGTLRWLFRGLSLANGLAFDVSGSKLFVCDSISRKILEWQADQVQSGYLADPRTFRSGFQGEPDGLTVDRHNRVWVAEWGSGRILVFDSRAQIIGSLQFSTPFVTSLSFVGPSCNQILVTTANDVHKTSLDADIHCNGGDVLLLDLQGP